jgi:hypothetical protein
MNSHPLILFTNNPTHWSPRSAMHSLQPSRGYYAIMRGPRRTMRLRLHRFIAAVLRNQCPPRRECAVVSSLVSSVYVHLRSLVFKSTRPRRSRTLTVFGELLPNF